MLAISVREAIRDAVAAFAPPGTEVPLALPATCEAIFMAIQGRRRELPSMQEPRPSEVLVGR
jgi:xanthine dehydrogenase large subunit